MVAVTGGGGGVGRATCLRFADEGAAVAVVDANGEAARAVADEIAERGGQGLAWEIDVTSSTAVDAGVSAIHAELGSLDILVNNAGVHATTLIHQVPDEEWDRLVAVNLSGSFYFARAAQRCMVSRRSGAIVNVASQAVLGTERGFVSYSASKAGVVGMTRALALDLGPFEITVNAVGPGHVETPLTHALATARGVDYEEIRAEQIRRNALKRVAQPEDIAGVIAFLASSDARHVTGQMIYVTGRPNL